MKVIIEGESKEIAELIKTIQSKQVPKSIEVICDGKAIYKSVYEMSQKKGIK